MSGKKDKTNDDNYLSTQYLNNENPYAFRQNYEANLANMPYNKERLNLLHRLQPQKVNVTFDQQSLNDERKYMIEEAIAVKRKKLIDKGCALINIEPLYEREIENTFEQHIDNEEVLDILLDLKRLNLIYQQMRLRARVSHVLSMKIPENTRIDTKNNEKVVSDNLKEALIFSNLDKLYAAREEEKDGN